MISKWKLLHESHETSKLISVFFDTHGFPFIDQEGWWFDHSIDNLYLLRFRGKAKGLLFSLYEADFPNRTIFHAKKLKNV